MVKKSEDLKKSKKSEKITFFIFTFFAEEKNVILLVFQYLEDAIRPELSSPTCFRILGGTLSLTEEKDGRRKSSGLI